MRVYVSNEKEAFGMGRFSGRQGYSCLRPVGVRFSKKARMAYQMGWEEGCEERAASARKEGGAA